MAQDGNVIPLAAIQANSAQTDDDPMLNEELGIPNVLPGSAWQDWMGGQNSKQPGGQFIVGRDPLAPSMAELVQMGRRDGQARALLSLLTLPMRSSLGKGEWKAPDGENPEHPNVQFANDMWTLPVRGGGMSVTSTKVIKQTLLSLLHGFTAFEHVRTVSEVDGPLKGKIVLDKLAYRDPRTLYFLCDDHGNFAGLRQIASFANRVVDVVIPEEKCFYYAINEEENPFYGVSMFEAAFEHYQIKRKLYYISHIAAQFGAVPGRLGYLPANPNKTQMDKFRQALANFSFNTSMMVPKDYDVKPFVGTTQFNFMAYIDHHNTMMASSVLAKFLQQEDRQVLIDNGKADASADMFVQALDAITQEIAQAWTNDLMPQYIDFNFNDPVYPVFTPAPMTDDQKNMLSATFNALALAPTLNVTPEFVRQLEEEMAKIFNFDIDYDAIAKREAEAQEQQQEQDQQQAAQQAAQAAQQATQQGEAGTAGAQDQQPQFGPPQAGNPQQQVAASNTDQALDNLLLQLTEIAAMDVDHGDLAE